MATVVFVSGPAGSGKGTNCKRAMLDGLCDEYREISGLLRRYRNKPGSVGDAVRIAMDAGRNVDDSVVNPMLLDFLNSILSGVIVVDGFPRNTNQARLAEETVRKSHEVHYVFFALNDRECLRRLNERRERSLVELEQAIMRNPSREGELRAGMRGDEDPEVQKNRLALYRGQEKEILDFLVGRAAGRVHIIDSCPPEDVVYSRVLGLLGEIRGDVWR